MTSGCSSHDGHPADSSVAPVGRSTHAIDVGGQSRSYQLYRPAALPAHPALVIVLHGGFGSGTQAESSYGWDALADREHVVVAYPNGLNRAWSVGSGCCGTPGRRNVDDVGFIEQVVADVGRATRVDPNRVYATGISNGGLLAYRLACDTTTFAAIGPVSATLLGDCPDPAPTSVIHIHGSADTRIRYSGGRGEGVAHIDGPAVPTVLARWRAVDGCPAPVTTTSGPVTTSTAKCPGGRAVELITIAGAGHQWPGAPPRPGAEKVLGTDPPSQALDATSTIWQFFAAHPKAG